jgi:aspartyl-tRNA(Asn)/glutamyl-tRNA(Gln) amidotransferase subunit A
MSDDPCSLTATQLLRLYRRKALSPMDVVRAVLQRIEEHNPRLNAFNFIAPDALTAAKMSEARWSKGEPIGPLDGVPVSIKDIVLTRGWPTLRGSQTINPKGPWNDDAPAVARLREAGAVLLGKTTTPEFGWKGVTDCALTGITRNPWNPECTPGGSSGGGAAAVAAGMGPLTIGTDGGGSIRIPCGFTGLFGLKPSFGRVPAWPLSPFGTVAHLGPMTRTVADAALMMNVLTLPDARDWHALPYDARDYRVGLEDGIKGMRIAYSPDLGYAKVDYEVAALVREAVHVLAELGAHVEEVGPGFESPAEIFRVHWYAGAAYVLSALPAELRKLVDLGMREVASEGAKITLKQHMDAVQNRGALGIAMNTFHTQYDLLITPTLPIPAFHAGKEVPEGSGMKRWTEWTPFSYPFNLTQQPAATVPCGFTSTGLPVGMQIVGPRYADALVLRAARAFESARPFQMPDMNALPEPQAVEAATAVDIGSEEAPQKVAAPAPSAPAHSSAPAAPAAEQAKKDSTGTLQPGSPAVERTVPDVRKDRTGEMRAQTPAADRTSSNVRAKDSTGTLKPATPPAEQAAPKPPSPDATGSNKPASPDRTGGQSRVDETTIVLPPRKPPGDRPA